jgi:hypothetical protein
MVRILPVTRALFLLVGFGFPVVFVVLYQDHFFAVTYQDGSTFIVQNAGSWSVWLLVISSVALLVGLSLGFIIQRVKMKTAPQTRPESGGELAAMGCVMTPVSALVLGLFGYFLPQLLDRVVVTDGYVESVTHRPYFLPPVTNRLEFKDMYDVHVGSLIEWQHPTTGRPGQLKEPTELLMRARAEIVRRGQQRPNPLPWSEDDIYCFFRQERWTRATTYVLQGNKLVIIWSRKGGWVEDDLGNVSPQVFVTSVSGIAGWAQLSEDLMAKVKLAAVREWISDPSADIVTRDRFFRITIKKGVERTIIRPSSEQPIKTFSSEQSLRQFLDDLESAAKEGTTKQPEFFDWWTKDKRIAKLVDNPRMPR